MDTTISTVAGQHHSAYVYTTVHRYPGTPLGSTTVCTWEWMAQEMQYTILMYNFGIVYSAWKGQYTWMGNGILVYTLTLLMLHTVALLTMLQTVKHLIALSLATQHEQLEQHTNVTCPQPFLLHPVFCHFLVCLVDGTQNKGYTVDGLTMRGIFVGRA